jgi:CMP/dCMP kinase
LNQPAIPSKELISISGDIGSGKSAVGKRVAAALGWEYMSTGAIYREIAAARSMTVLELNQYGEKNPEIDFELDKRSTEIGRTRSRLVIDSRMAWHFIPHSFKVFLAVSVQTGAQRIVAADRSHETYASVEEAQERIVARRASEKSRYQMLYGVDVADQSHFDLVINTETATIEQEVDLLIADYRKWAARQLV